jgi:hypothetical protein
LPDTSHTNTIPPQTHSNNSIPSYKNLDTTQLNNNNNTINNNSNVNASTNGMDGMTIPAVANSSQPTVNMNTTPTTTTLPLPYLNVMRQDPSSPYYDPNSFHISSETHASNLNQINMVNTASLYSSYVAAVNSAALNHTQSNNNSATPSATTIQLDTTINSTTH